MARPSKFDPAFIEKGRELAEQGMTDEEMAEEFGVDVRTLYRWKADNEAFCQALKAGKELPDECVVQSLYKMALDGNVTAAIFWLKNRQPNKWRDKVQNEHSGPNGGPMQQVTTVRLVPLLPKSGDE